jgi:HAD superfamily hydrolase (TIGR01509 family)
LHFGKLAEEYGLNPDDFKKSRRKYVSLSSTGKMSADEYVKKIADIHKIKDVEKFKKRWIELKDKYAYVDNDVKELILKLKKNYIIGTLTNAIPLHHETRVKKGVYDLPYDINMISYEHGTEKPEKEFYKILIKKLNLIPGQIVFIDDCRSNLPPAEELKIKTILFKNAGQLLQDLKKLGVKI